MGELHKVGVCHGALPNEAALDADSRVLEMRVYWGTILLDIEHHRHPRSITIGETKNTDVFISSEGLPTDAFPLIRSIDGDYVLTFTTAMDGEIEQDGTLHTLATLRGTSLAIDPHFERSYQVKLLTDARAIVSWGGITFAFRFVPPVQASPNRLWHDIDLQAANLLLVSVFLHLAVIVTLLVAPRDAESLREDIFAGPHHALLFEAPRMSEKVVNKLVELEKERSAPLKHTPTAAAPVASARKTPTDKQNAAIDKIRALFHGGRSGDSGNILGGTSISTSLADMIGTTRLRATNGLTSLGTRGGFSTGGPPGTSRGVANIGTVGRLGSPAYGVSQALGLRKERNLAELSTPVVVGALARELIQRVINANKAQIRYCYEVELQRDQGLAGKVALKWIIGATGAVTQVVVTESTLPSPRVGRCLADKIRSWRFPQPAGGGIVEVNYPFVFKSS